MCSNHRNQPQAHLKKGKCVKESKTAFQFFDTIDHSDTILRLHRMCHVEYDAKNNSNIVQYLLTKCLRATIRQVLFSGVRIQLDQSTTKRASSACRRLFWGIVGVRPHWTLPARNAVPCADKLSLTMTRFLEGDGF